MIAMQGYNPHHLHFYAVCFDTRIPVSHKRSRTEAHPFSTHTVEEEQHQSRVLAREIWADSTTHSMVVSVNSLPERSQSPKCLILPAKC